MVFMHPHGSLPSFLSREKPMYSNRRELKKVYDKPAVLVSSILAVMGLLRSSSIGFLGPVSPGSLSSYPKRTFFDISSGRCFSIRSGLSRSSSPFSTNCIAAIVTISFVQDRRGTISFGFIARDG